jgi:transposase-like protein
MMVGVRTNRLSYGLSCNASAASIKPQGTDGPVTGDQYTYVAMSASSRAIISHLTGKRNSENTDAFIQDIRDRVVGLPEISTDGFHSYKNAIRDAFGNRALHGVIVKTYGVTHLAVKDAARRDGPAEVVAVARDVVSGVPAQISTSYVERSHLTLRQSSKGLRCAPAMALGITDRV